MLRRAGWVLMVAVMALLTACGPQTPGPDAIDWKRPYCPFDQNLVLFGGDSLTTKWPAYIPLPSGMTRYNTAKGGLMYSRNVTLDPTFGTIGSNLIDDLDECGNGIGAAVFGGGGVDLSWGISGGEVIAAIDALDEEMYARSIPTIFVTMTPVSDATPWNAAHQADRKAVNAWMTTPGNLHATVVDCSPALESAPGSDVLAQQYWNLTDVFGTVDLLHPNEAGYAAIAACVRPAILTASGH